MANINNKDLEIINDFYGKFAELAVKTISESLDVAITFENKFAQEVPDIASLKDSCAVCEVKSIQGYLGYALAAVPEALISTISDLIMGGTGVDAYKGSLTELEINASSGMFENLFDKIRTTFTKDYVKELVFASLPKFVGKGTKEHAEAFEKGFFDASVTCNLKINGAQEFKAVLLLNSDELVASLKNIHLIEEVSTPVAVQPTQINLSPASSQKMGTYDIKKIADIKIDISAELGRAQVSIKQVLSLVRGSILELDTMENSDISVFANGSEVARAQVVVVDGHFGIKIIKILNPQERFKSI